MDFKNIDKKTWVYEDLAFIIPMKLLRNTPSVEFYTIPEVMKHLDAVDKVIHKPGAKSPMIKGDSKHYWYMHTDQEDKIVVHEGKRVIELYSHKHNKIEKFQVDAHSIRHKGKILYKGAAILGWPKHVFHRISSPEGSISTNYAKHFKNFDLKTNFNIYDIDVKENKHWIVREGHKDQPKYDTHPGVR